MKTFAGIGGLRRYVVARARRFEASARASVKAATILAIGGVAMSRLKDVAAPGKCEEEQDQVVLTLMRRWIFKDQTKAQRTLLPRRRLVSPDSCRV